MPAQTEPTTLDALPADILVSLPPDLRTWAALARVGRPFAAALKAPSGLMPSLLKEEVGPVGHEAGLAPAKKCARAFALCRHNPEIGALLADIGLHGTHPASPEVATHALAASGAPAWAATLAAIALAYPHQGRGARAREGLGRLLAEHPDHAYVRKAVVEVVNPLFRGDQPARVRVRVPGGMAWVIDARFRNGVPLRWWALFTMDTAPKPDFALALRAAALNPLFGEMEAHWACRLLVGLLAQAPADGLVRAALQRVVEKAAFSSALTLATATLALLPPEAGPGDEGGPAAADAIANLLAADDAPWLTFLEGEACGANLSDQAAWAATRLLGRLLSRRPDDAQLRAILARVAGGAKSMAAVGEALETMAHVAPFDFLPNLEVAALGCRALAAHHGIIRAAELLAELLRRNPHDARVGETVARVVAATVSKEIAAPLEKAIEAVAVPRGRHI